MAEPMKPVAPVTKTCMPNPSPCWTISVTLRQETVVRRVHQVVPVTSRNGNDPRGRCLHMTKADATTRKARGRPPATAATAHDVILEAVYELLQKKSVRNLTIEEVANRAGIGKPTIYRWWPSKAALVMDVFEERVAAQFRVPEAATAAATIRGSVMVLI